MLEVILMSVDRILLSLIIGGMIIMVVCVRPLLLQQLTRKDSTEFSNLVEGISINAWNRYNKVAFAAIVVMLVIDLIQFTMGNKYTYGDLVLEIIILFLFLLKFTLDYSLKKRLSQYGNAAVNSSEQNRGHWLVELLSKVILVISIVLTMLS
ncbi:hypothetical protein [Niallia sp. Krafla_26]|uniref:hypothetical protein n=1 Tax=Niallia sp. Krafla_26 TaxID=3064703 RepID=UPI003D176360